MGCHSLSKDLPNPGMKPRSSELQADFLPSESLGKPIPGAPKTFRISCEEIKMSFVMLMRHPSERPR